MGGPLSYWNITAPKWVTTPMNMLPFFPDFSWGILSAITKVRALSCPCLAATLNTPITGSVICLVFFKQECSLPSIKHRFAGKPTSCFDDFPYMPLIFCGGISTLPMFDDPRRELFIHQHKSVDHFAALSIDLTRECWSLRPDCVKATWSMPQGEVARGTVRWTFASTSKNRLDHSAMMQIFRISSVFYLFGNGVILNPSNTINTNPPKW